MQPEPEDFYEKVKKDGEAFLARNPKPETSAQWKNKEYWRQAIPDLKQAYRNVCSYCCLYIHRVTGGPSVDHYISRYKSPKHAYEWSNFRLACALMNSRKGVSEDVIDPFLLKEDWFTIDFTTFMMMPSDNLNDDEKKQVMDTINRLQLNEDDACVEARKEYVDQYISGDTKGNFAFLEKEAPFIAYEMKRQGLA